MWRCVVLAIGILGATACGFMPAGPGAGDPCDRDEEDCDATAGALTEEVFLELWVASFCDAWERCGATVYGECSVSIKDLHSQTQGCRYDAERASDCLDAGFSCHSDTGGPGGYPVQPDVCAQVYDCG